ncbi:MAG: TRAP transporter small permease subunit [Gammaproteobacteria bacterium]|nr:TRAP transporter small permease subunit [Gammaproteobacteria bacterium]
MANVLGAIERLVALAGRAAAWLLLPLLAVMCAVVLLRYFFNTGSVALQELVVYLHASVFMLALAWTLQTDQHVRVDVFYREFTPRRKAMVDLLGTVLFLLPVSGLVLVHGSEYALASWQALEGSRESGGLPFLYLLKTVIPLSALLLLLQGLCIALRSIFLLRGER